MGPVVRPEDRTKEPSPPLSSTSPPPPPQPNGKDVTVTVWNLEEYVDLVVQSMLKTSIAPQVAAFRKGFNLATAPLVEQLDL